jgi:hypothetical protein
MTADLMRQYLDIVENRHDLDQVFADPSARRVLAEGATLTEGAIADRINAAMAKVKSRFGQATPQLLTQAVAKAESLFQGDQAIASLLARVKTLGRSPVLLAAMIGICGALIGMAPNPAAAQDMAAKTEQVLGLGEVNMIVDALEEHGIKCAPNAQTKGALPAGLTEAQTKAAQCLKAIADYQFFEGGNMTSVRSMLNTIAVKGGITREGALFSETVTLYSADGELKLSEYTTSYIVEDGVPSITDEDQIGFRFDLWTAFRNMPEEQQNAVSNWVNQNSQMNEAAGAVQGLEQMLKAKGRDFCLLVATVAMRNGRVAGRVSMTSKGIQVA